MNATAEYHRRIRNRNLLRFCVGLMARLPLYLLYRYRAWRMRDKGAFIGVDCCLVGRNLVQCANANLRIGSHTSIHDFLLDTRSPIHIGNHVIIGSGRCITASHDVDSSEWTYKSYGLTIEDYSWIATDVMILPSCRRIGYGAVVGAGAVVVKDVPSMAIVSGNPARIIRMRKCIHHNCVVESFLGGDLVTYVRTWLLGRKGRDV